MSVVWLFQKHMQIKKDIICTLFVPHTYTECYKIQNKTLTRKARLPFVQIHLRCNYVKFVCIYMRELSTSTYTHTKINKQFYISLHFISVYFILILLLLFHNSHAGTSLLHTRYEHRCGTELCVFFSRNIIQY